MILTSIDPQLRVAPVVRLRAPADVLRDDYMLPSAMDANALAERSGIPATHVRRLLAGAPIYAEEALLLASALRTTALYWLMLQARYDLERARRLAKPRSKGAR